MAIGMVSDKLFRANKLELSCKRWPLLEPHSLNCAVGTGIDVAYEEENVIPANDCEHAEAALAVATVAAT